MSENRFRDIPSIDELLKESALTEAACLYSAPLVTEALRCVLGSVRGEIAAGKAGVPDRGEIALRAVSWIEGVLGAGLKRMVNASGTVLHTNIGRAVLAREACDALNEAASGPVDLEFDTFVGKRGERDSHVEETLKRLTGAEAACVVNNNAAAVLITLNTLAEGREVVVSRGELVEIGGGFRLPEIIEKSGCVLREVGTTNRTHQADYSDNIKEETAVILKAHTSNYKIVGFVSAVSLKELSAIAEGAGLPLVEDLGSGSLVDLSRFGLGKNMREPVVGESLRAGADIVTFSGDKLLGGPQAGLIVGRKKIIDRIKKNPLKRALRAGKLTLSALEATLKLYLNDERLAERLPTLKYLSRPIGEVEKLAEEAAVLLRERLGEGYAVETAEGEAQAGSGALPMETLSSWVVKISHPEVKPEDIFLRFLKGHPPILGRVHHKKFILDMRTVEDAKDILPR